MSHANMQCGSIFGDPLQRTTDTLALLNEVYRDGTEPSSKFWETSVEVLVKAIDHYKFSDINIGVLIQVRDYLTSIEKGPLSTREKLLLSIIEFNTIGTNGTEHIEQAIQTLRSIPVPSRRAPEFNWHLANFYYALGDKERSYALLTYIINTAIVQPNTHLYFNIVHNEVGSPYLSEQTERSLQRSSFRMRPMYIDRANWGPYVRAYN